MFVDKRQFWDDRYKKREKRATVDSFLTENRHLLPKKGRVLDVACGLGGNALYLAQIGLTVEAWDFSASAVVQLQEEALGQGVKIEALQRDVIGEPWPVERFDLITVSRFLERSLVDAMVLALKPGGLLFYQTFIQLKTEEVGPKNPAYRLEKNELLSLFVPALELVFYREEWELGRAGSRQRDSAFLIGKRPMDSF
jgi:tellurite methyltransferase